MTDAKEQDRTTDVSHKRKADESDEQRTPKRLRLSEAKTKLLERRKKIHEEKQALINPLKDKIKELSKEHEDKYAQELEEIESELDHNKAEQQVELVRERLLCIVKDAAANPEMCYLFDNHMIQQEGELWAPVRALINEKLGGYMECRGYFALEATEEQIACNWNYSSLEWKAEDQDRYYNSKDNIREVPVASSQPGFYLIDVDGLAIKDGEAEIDASHCKDLVWDGDAPDEDDIEWDTDESTVYVFGRMFVDLSMFTLRKDAEKVLYE